MESRSHRPLMAAAGLGVVALVLGSASVEAQYRPELFAGPTVGRIHGPPGNATVTGFNLGFGIGLGGQSLLIGPETLLLNGSSQRVRAFAVAVRLRRRVGTVHPHLLAAIGAYSWQTRPVLTLPELSVLGGGEWVETDSFAGSIGAGLTVGGLTKPVSGVVEARWHRNLNQNGADGSRSLLAMTAGIRLVW